MVLGPVCQACFLLVLLLHVNGRNIIFSVLTHYFELLGHTVTYPLFAFSFAVLLGETYLSNSLRQRAFNQELGSLSQCEEESGRSSEVRLQVV